jgi:tripartite-type tricarboxylate transporter receptor subunit TctC
VILVGGWWQTPPVEIAREQTMLGNRVAIRGLVAVSLALGLFVDAHAQAYPNRTIRIIAPVTPGSPVDALGRVVAQQVQAGLGQSVVIENRPGGSMAIGAKAVATADPDGYTLLLVSNGLYFGLARNEGYHPVKSFTPVATLAEWNHVLVVRPDFPAKTVQELVAYAKANPGKVKFGFGLSTPPQILGETLKNVTGADITSVPYRGGAPAMTDMLGGRIDMNFGTTATLLPLIQQGKVRAIAFTGVKRSPDLPDVPTMIESGFPQVSFNPDNWTAISAPAGTPRAVIDRLYTAINEALRSPELAPSFAKFGFEVMIKQQGDLEAFVASEAQRWPPIVKAAGLRPE